MKFVWTLYMISQNGVTSVADYPTDTAAKWAADNAILSADVVEFVIIRRPDPLAI